MKCFYFDDIGLPETLIIDRFRGIDYLTHPSKVDISRSPDALNIISNEAYFPVKRFGYTKISALDKPIYGLYCLKKNMQTESAESEQDFLLVHAGGSLYSFTLDGQTNKIYDDMNEDYSCAFVMKQNLYILDGKTYLQFDGTDIKPVHTVAFVPTTTINAPPKGGGTFLEGANLLNSKRINTFVPDGSSNVFKLDTDNIDNSGVLAKLNGEPTAITSVDRKAGKVTLTSTPPSGNGVATLSISFSKPVEGGIEKINKCRFFGMYGGKNDTRVFFSGNPDTPNVDYQSGLYEPTYFPDTGYTKIGSDNSAIMGYARQYDAQVIIKESNGQDATQYLRTFTLDNNSKAMYPLKQGAKGSGAISTRCFVNLRDVPMFLSQEGVQAVMGTNVSEQRSISNVSARINPKLCCLSNLKDAVACQFKDRYYLAVDNKCFVADSNISYDNGQIEWFYWDNIPATVFMEYEGHLYFGTNGGKIMRFCDESDQYPYRDENDAIHAYWSTPFSPLGTWNYKKTVTDFFPVLIPDLRSGVYVKINTDDRYKNIILKKNLDLFSFLHMDFKRFSFKSIKTANVYRAHQKIRKINTFQAIVGNDKIDEGFGVLALVTKYVYGNQML